MTRIWVLALLTLPLAQVALAQSRVVVLPFDGPGAARVRGAVVQVLSTASGFETVSEKDVRNAAQAQGADLSSDAGRVAVARQLTLSAFIEGTVTKHGASATLSARVYAGRDGVLLGEASIKARAAGLNQKVKERFLPELAAALGRAQPPAAAPAPAPAPEPEPVQAIKPTSPPPPPRAVEPEPEIEPEEPSGPRPKALELSAGVRLLTRHYVYRDVLLAMSEHKLDPTPAFRLEARWYPAAHVTSGFVSNLGLDLHAQMLYPVDATKGTATFKTTGFAFGIAARLRIPLGEHQLGVFVGYGGQSLALADSKGVDPGVPSVSYGFLRLGADGRVALSHAVSLGVRAAYLLMTGFGEIGQAAWFSHVGGGGLEAELSVRYALTEAIAFDAGLGLTRYFLSLAPNPNDVGVKTNGHIAGGLTDQYLHGMLGVTLRL
jgi:hypothetical protein